MSQAGPQMSSNIIPRASPAFLTCGLLRSRLGIVRASSALLSLLPSGDFKVFAPELLMSDYDMGDGGHEFRTSWTTDRTMPRLLPMEQRAQSHACMNFAEIPEQARQPVAFRNRGSHQATYR